MPAAESAESPRPGAESTGAYDAVELLSRQVVEMKNPKKTQQRAKVPHAILLTEAAPVSAVLSN